MDLLEDMFLRAAEPIDWDWLETKDEEEERIMEQKTLTALQGSIRKWDQIMKGEIPSLGTINCPLCRVFYGDLNTPDDKDCLGCPVMEETGEPLCEGSPYNDFVPVSDVRKGESGWWATNKAARSAAAEELAFLISLLPEGVPTGLEEKKSDSSSPVPNADQDPVQDSVRGGGPG